MVHEIGIVTTLLNPSFRGGHREDLLILMVTILAPRQIMCILAYERFSFWGQNQLVKCAGALISLRAYRSSFGMEFSATYSSEKRLFSIGVCQFLASLFSRYYI